MKLLPILALLTSCVAANTTEPIAANQESTPTLMESAQDVAQTPAKSRSGGFDAGGSGPFSVLGHWGVLGEEDAERNVSRDRRSRWPDKRVPEYFGQVRGGFPVPRFDPALVMGIAIDVESGNVLAVDAVQPYGSRSFPPTQHPFTPGSIFKAVVMATALDRGVVKPTDRFETFYPAGIVVRDQNGHARRVMEAEGAPDAPTITASQGLSRLVNAVLVQIGLKLPAADLGSSPVDLRYGARPGVGLAPRTRGVPAAPADRPR